MLKITIKNGEVLVEANGKTNDISAETILAVRGIYRSLKEKNERAADKFRDNILEAMSDEVPFLTNEEIDKLVKKRQKEMIECLPPELKELINGIQELAEKAKETGINITPVVVDGDRMEEISNILGENNDDDCDSKEEAKSINLECGTITAKIDGGEDK